MLKRVIVETPASIANFGPGYDTFGLCLNAPCDILELERKEGTGITIEQIGLGNESQEGPWKIPTDPEKNTAGIAASEMLRISGKNIGLHMKIRKCIKAGSGLGSSASSAVGGALAAAELLAIKDEKKILSASAKGEGATSGAAHLDNVSPCLFGGFTVVIDHEKLDVLRIVPPEMKIVVCQPSIIIETAKARELIPKHVPVKTSISHSSWASGIVHGMKTKDVKLIAKCLQDEIAVPARKQLIPGFDQARDAALNAGALSFSISGSGPAVYSIALRNHMKIGQAIVDAFSKAGIQSNFFFAKPGKGARVVRRI